MNMKLFAILAGLSIITLVGCKKDPEYKPPTEDVPSSSAITTQNGFQIEMQSPSTADDIKLPTIKVKAGVSPTEEIRTVTLLVNDTETIPFTRLPLEITLPSKYSNKFPLKLTIKATSFSGKVSTFTRTIEASAVGPGTTPIAPVSKNGGVLDSNCMTNNSYDACIFWKSPVAVKGASFSPVYTSGSDSLASFQTFGIKLTGITDLKNSTIDVYGPGSTRAPASGKGPSTYVYSKGTPLNGSWKIAYKTDASAKRISQIMAFHWLNQLVAEFKTRMGKFYAEGKNIKVYAYDDNPNDQYIAGNAYWSDSSKSIHIGFLKEKSGRREVANGADVYIHEMGHANLQYAAGSKLNQRLSETHTQDTRGNMFCKTDKGCLGGINEGQADFHTFFVFAGHSKLGEDFMNDPKGFPSRDAATYVETTAQVLASKSRGEVHAMGSVYSAILWKIYTDSEMKKSDFESIFNEHLPLLSGNTTFAGARDAMLSIDTAKFSGKYKSIIKAAFSSRGVN